MNNKELKAYWSSKTLGEIRGFISETERVLNNMNDIIKMDARKITELDTTYKYYVRDLNDLADSIKRRAKDIKDSEALLAIVKPILEKKELEGIDQKEYEDYITNNVDIKVLIKAVNDDKEKFIADGSKVILNIRNKEGKPEQKTIILTEKQVNEMFDTMLKETIMIIKDNAGDLKEVKYLRSNGNRGMDGQFKGEKGTVNIVTILAGGYNIQQLHYRTLVYR